MPYDEETGEFYPDNTTPRSKSETEVTFKLSYESDQLMEAIVSKIAADRRNHIEKMLNAAIERKVSELVDEAAATRIGDAVEQILRDGFQQTNSYGQPEGARLTLKAMITKHITGNSYSRTNLPSIVDEVLKRRFESEINAATKTIRGMVDDEISARLNKALREALGVK